MAQTNLDPYGKVFVHGEIWDAHAAAPVAAGRRVVVRGVQDLQLEVDPLAERAPVLV
jgi:membrane-bound ClpP family serine protease